MPGFLQEVAADLYDRYGDDISSLSVLFPSRRARLFFIDALSGIAERPLWQPRWTTIDELMSEISGLRIGDRVRLVTELYKVYSEFHPESFDKFYFWGEMLLTDFDTIDKYLIDADMLFRNLADIKELEADVSYLSPVQLKSSLSGPISRTKPPFPRRNAASWPFGRRWARSIGLSASGSGRWGWPIRGWCTGRPPSGSRPAVSHSRSPGGSSWRASTRSRSARNGFSSFSPRLPKPISTGITILIIRTMPTRRPVCSCARTGSCFPPGANFRTIISGRRSESKRFPRYRTPCNASTWLRSCGNWLPNRGRWGRRLPSCSRMKTCCCPCCMLCLRRSER